MELITEHWRTNNTETTGRPHYRLIRSHLSIHSEDLGMPGSKDVD